MSELINAYPQNGLRRRLLTTVSAIALLTVVSAKAVAAENTDGHPTLWIELGGQFDQLNAGASGWVPPVTPPPFPPVTSLPLGHPVPNSIELGTEDWVGHNCRGFFSAGKQRLEFCRCRFLWAIFEEGIEPRPELSTGTTARKICLCGILQHAHGHSRKSCRNRFRGWAGLGSGHVRSPQPVVARSGRALRTIQFDGQFLCDIRARATQIRGNQR